MGYVDNLDKFFMEDNKHDKYVSKSEKQALIRLSLNNIKMKEKKKELKINKTIIKRQPSKNLINHYLGVSARSIEESMRYIRRQIEEKYLDGNNY